MYIVEVEVPCCSPAALPVTVHEGIVRLHCCSGVQQLFVNATSLSKLEFATVIAAPNAREEVDNAIKIFASH
jgi:hypothetical protein